LGSSTSTGARLVALAAATLACAGCATGHLLDRARRWERPVAWERAAVADGRLEVAYTAAIRDQFWRPRATRRRRAAVPLAQFGRVGLTADAVRWEPRPPDAPVVGTPIRLRAEPGAADGGRLFAACDGEAFLHPAVLTRRRLAPWVYPLLPLAVAYDVVAVPVLLALAPLVIVPGD
jgi:hypothetical protein